jgi:NAD(P)-dependent dehydrogenase (short-subunit alcohol dehydrogenase family)
MEQLAEKVAVITGAASGIGRAFAERFAAEQMRLVIADVNEPRLREVEAFLSENGAAVATMRCDTSSEADVEALAQLALERFGAAHLLCNNAGIGGMGDAWIDSMGLWTRVVGVNLYGVVHGIRAFLPIMTEQGEGHIVNTASMAGLLPMPGAAPYNATKHGVVALSEGLFLELEAIGSPVGVSVLCPGWVRTNLMENEPESVSSPVGNLINTVVRESVESIGIAPEDVADQVVDAIRANRFWILTHRDMKPAPVERMQRAADGVNPTLPVM